eukprot:6517407-Pyramimonas_sp.AAC.4
MPGGLVGPPVATFELVFHHMRGASEDAAARFGGGGAPASGADAKLRALGLYDNLGGVVI